MSIINKMLQDLESRKGDNASKADYQPPVHKQSPVRALLYLLLAILVFIAVIWWWLNSATPVPAPRTAGITPVNQQRDAEDAQPVHPDSASSDNSSTTAGSPSVNTTTEPAVSPELTAIAEPAAAGLTIDQVSVNSQDKGGADTPLQPSTMTVEPDDAPESAPIEEEKTPVLEVSKRAATAQEIGVSLREQIRVALSNENEAQAIALLHSLMAREPDNIGVKKKLAALMFGEGQVTEAQTLLNHSIRLHPADESLRLMQARLLRQQNQLAAAFEVLEHLPNAVFPSLEFLGVRASIAQELGNLNAALADYNQLAARDGENAKWWLGVAVVADKLQQPQVADQAYAQAFRMNQLGPDVQDFIQARRSALAGQQ